MAQQLRTDQKCTVSLSSITDNSGNPAKIDGLPDWSVAPDGVVALAVAEDGMSVVVTAEDINVGGDEEPDFEAALLTVRVDADLGEGVRELVGTLEFQVIAGEAQVIGLTVGEPEPKA